MAKDATVKDVREFFDTPGRRMTLADMKAEWIPMSKEEKTQILKGLSDGTLTY